MSLVQKTWLQQNEALCIAEMLQKQYISYVEAFDHPVKSFMWIQKGREGRKGMGKNFAVLKPWQMRKMIIEIINSLHCLSCMRYSLSTLYLFILGGAKVGL